MGYLKSWGTSFIYVSFFLAVITFMPGCPPDVKLSEYSVGPSIKLEEIVPKNDRLNDPEFLYDSKLIGPEYFATYNGELYTTAIGGHVWKIGEDKVVPFVKFGKKCDYLWQDEKCGRPLGITSDKKGGLYVIDTYYGLYKVDATGKYNLVINTSKPIDNVVPLCPNSLDVAKNGDIFWSHSSSKFVLKDGLLMVLSNPSGRLIRYNSATKKNTVLIDNLAFANGVMLSDDESFVIVAESFTSRIMKYNLKGPKAGTKEVFIEGLPGLPDNIHGDGQGGFLITTVMYIDSENPSLVHTLMPHPYIRKMLLRTLWLIQASFRSINNIYSNYYMEYATHMIGSFKISSIFNPDKMAVLRIDRTGNIIDAAYSTDGKLKSISSAFIHKDYLWLGTYDSRSLARVPLKKAFPDLVHNRKNTKDSTVNGPTLQNVKELPETSTVKTTEPSTTKASVSSKKTGNSMKLSTKSTDTATNAPKPTAATTASTEPTTTTSTPTLKQSNIPKSNTASKSNDDSTEPTTTKLNTETIPKATVKKIKTNTEEESKKSEKPTKHSSKTKESKEKVKLQDSDSVKKGIKPDVPKSNKN